MNINALIYEYTKLMAAAEACQSRREAVTLIRKATRLLSYPYGFIQDQPGLEEPALTATLEYNECVS